MRVKVVPEDFRVTETLNLSVKQRGPYAVYRVKKRDLTTLEVQAALAGRLGLPLSSVQFPALKDKTALAIQHAAVKINARLAPSHIEGKGFSAQLVGFLSRPLRPRDLGQNEFTVTLRDVHAREAEHIRTQFEMIGREGFPNYFDLQRFGSFSARLGFPGKLLLLGRWEEALRAYLAEPLVGDPPPVLRFKRQARESWGDWPRLKAAAPRGNLRSVLTFLCDHPQDYKRAVNLITPRVLSLWLSAYQSFLWNKMASHVLCDLASGRQALERLPFPWGEVVVPLYPLDAEFREQALVVTIPLPSAKSPVGKEAAPCDRGAWVARATGAVLAEEGLQPADLRVRGLKRAYLGRGVRALWVVPTEPRIGEPEPDELFPGRLKLVCSFTLPPGSYATLFLRLLGPRWPLDH